MSLAIKNLPTIDTNRDPLSVKHLLQSIDYNFSELYIDKFWDSIQGDKWIYINDDMLKWIGYNTIDTEMKRLYTKLLKDNFNEPNDYKQMNTKEFSMSDLTDIGTAEINPHNKTKHLVVSPDCFKESLMLLRTEKSKEIRKYYIEVEKIFRFYLQYQTKYQELKNLETIKQLELEKGKNINLTANAIDYNQLMKKEYLYIATNARYASQNNFKIGKTIDLKQRLSAYNTGHNKNEPYYYVFISEPTYYAKSIEYIIKHILTKFRNSDTNELYIARYEFLEKIVGRIFKNYDDSVDYYNKCIQEEMELIGTVQTVPKNIWKEEEETKEEPEVVEHNDKQETIEYVDDNKEYPFIRFKTDADGTNYKCGRCELIFHRLDGLKNHLRRKNKCYENDKEAKIEAIKNSDTPTTLYYNDNKEYPYYETYSADKEKITYNCGRCAYNTTTKRSLGTHFDRIFKCFNVKKYSNDKIEVEYIDNKKDYAYYRYLDNGIMQFHCNHCDYESNIMRNLNRHFQRKNTCY